MFAILKEFRDTIQTACSTAIKKYVIGKVAYPFKMELPFLCIYGTQTRLHDPLTTAKDKFEFTVVVDVYVGIGPNVAIDGMDADTALRTQRALYELMEKRTTDGIPDANTVLGAIRRIPYLRGTNFIFNNDVVIDYSEHLVEKSAYYKATLTFNAITKYNTRT